MRKHMQYVTEEKSLRAVKKESAGKIECLTSESAGWLKVAEGLCDVRRKIRVERVERVLVVFKICRP